MGLFLILVNKINPLRQKKAVGPFYAYIPRVD
jgi:hypothetical protein